MSDRAIDERHPASTDEALPVYSGATYRTDCTCATRRPARALIEGAWKEICAKCGSLRQNTGT